MKISDEISGVTVNADQLNGVPDTGYVKKYTTNSADWDTTPTNGSTKPVTSDGVYDAISALSGRLGGYYYIQATNIDNFVQKIVDRDNIGEWEFKASFATWEDHYQYIIMYGRSAQRVYGIMLNANGMFYRIGGTPTSVTVYA